MKKLLLIMLLFLTGVATTFAQKKRAVILSDKTGWHKIGETKVDFTRDRDEILVQGADRFATIQFRVSDASIHLLALDITYESGDNQQIKVNTDIKSPGTSRTIDLNGGERRLKKIVFMYKTVPNYKDKKAHVEIWGMKTNSDVK